MVAMPAAYADSMSQSIMCLPIPSLWCWGRTASRLRWACSSPKYMIAKATTRSRSQASSVEVSLLAIERATRSGPHDQPSPVSIRSRDIAAIFAASAGLPGLSVMFFAFIGRGLFSVTPRVADCRKKKGLERLHDGEYHRSGEEDHRNLVEPAVPDVRFRVRVPCKIPQELPAPYVVGDREGDDCELRVQPGAH